MKVLMFGPGKGHNIKRFLDYFEQHSEHQLSYVYFTAQEHYNLRESYPRIQFSSRWNFFGIIGQLRKEPHLIWVHNWTPLSLLFLIQFFRKKGSVLNFNVWSEPVPLLAKGSSFKGKIYRWFFEKCDSVQCTWYSTYNLLKDLPNINLVMLRWGMEEDRFKEPTPSEVDPEAVAFVEQLDQSKTNFFFPKSISGFNRHDLILEAVQQLVKDGVDKFRVYFWPGNHNNKELLSRYKNQIKQQKLEDHVSLHQHGFLSDLSINFIWRNMDCGLQILEKDQLSTSFQEPQLYEKELIASDIASYQYFEQEFSVDLKLVPNEPNALARRMKEVIQGELTSAEEKKKRRSVIEENYRFSLCMPKILDYFSSINTNTTNNG